MIQLIMALICLSLFFILLYCVVTKKIEKMDQSFYQKVSKKINKRNTFIMKGITFFGSTIGIIVCILLSFIFIKNPFDREFIVITILGEVLLNNLIKLIVKRLRPSINPLVVEKSHSFPSGHTMASTVFYSLIVFFLWKFPISFVIKIIITLFIIAMVMSIMYSRIYLGVHYLSDVLAGACCSLFYILIVTFLYTPIKDLMI